MSERVSVRLLRGAVAALVFTGVVVGTTVGSGPPAGAADDPDLPATVKMDTFPEDLPDPEVVHADGSLWAYGTETLADLGIFGVAAVHIPVLSADRLRGKWNLWADALPDPGTWVYDPGEASGARQTWAPAVQKVGDDWVMFYGAPRASSPLPGPDKQRCIGRAVSDSPGGPFTADPAPFHCPPGELWAIDPSVYRDDTTGSLYLHWREDTTGQPNGPHINGGQLSSDAASITSYAASFLLARDQAWEAWGADRGLIENPAMQEGTGPDGQPTYYLLYSGNDWNSENYATGYATCSTPLGPCVKRSTDANGVRVLRSTASDVAKGPGGAEFFKYNGRLYLAWHAFTWPAVGAPGPRGLRISRIDLGAAGPEVRRPMRGQIVDHAFMIDTTGSMGDDIDAVKQSTGEIVSRLSESGADWRVAVVEYKDYPQSPWGGPGDFTGRIATNFTSDPATLLGAILPLQASGGGDTPESFLSAAMLTLNPGQLHWRNMRGVKKTVTPFTDASFHSPEAWPGGYTFLDVIGAAFALDPAVFYPVVVGGDGAALAAFGEVADQTGGRVFTADDAGGVVDAILALLTEVLQAPTADAGGPYTARVGDAVLLDASASSDSDGTIVRYEWDADGDGSIDHDSATPTATHVYTAPGDYTAMVRVTDDSGLTQSATIAVHVDPAVAGDTVGVHVIGPFSADVSGTLTGDVDVATDRWGVTSVRGGGTVGSAAVDFDVTRFWILPLYLGRIRAGDASSGALRSAPVLFARVAWDPATRTASSSSAWPDFSRFPPALGRVAWSVADTA